MHRTIPEIRNMPKILFHHPVRDAIFKSNTSFLLGPSLSILLNNESSEKGGSFVNVKS